MILSQHVESGVAVRVLAEHPERLGYLLKDRVTDVEEFVGALRRVAAGGTALDPLVVSRLLAAEHDGPLQSLTPREREVLQLLAEGRSNPAIAERTRDHPAQRREVRVEHLREARPARHGRRAPARAGRARVPARLSPAPADPRSTGLRIRNHPPCRPGAPASRTRVTAMAGGRRRSRVSLHDSPLPTAVHPRRAHPRPRRPPRRSSAPAASSAATAAATPPSTPCAACPSTSPPAA